MWRKALRLIPLALLTLGTLGILSGGGARAQQGGYEFRFPLAMRSYVDLPHIDRLSTSSGKPGSLLIIYGSGFKRGPYWGRDLSSHAYVLISAKAEWYDYWWDNEIAVYVPFGLEHFMTLPAEVEVYVYVRGLRSNRVPFTVLAPDQ